MTAATIVKAGLGIYCGLAFVAVFLLWRNAAASDSLKNSVIALTSVFPLIISVLPYLTPETLQKKMNFVLLFDNVKQAITTGEGYNTYGHNYLHMFTNVWKVPGALTGSFDEFSKAKGRNLIEKAIVETLVVTFSQHWNLTEMEEHVGPIWTSRSYRADNSPKKTISVMDIQKLFGHNPLILTQGVLAFKEIQLPPRSKLNVAVSESSTTLKIVNPYVTLSIAIEPGGAGVAQHGIWGIQSQDQTNSNRYYAIEFRVSVQMSPGRTMNHAPQMELYRRWYANIVASLSQFDWPEVARQTQEALNREAISKALGLPSQSR